LLYWNGNTRVKLKYAFIGDAQYYREGLDPASCGVQPVSPNGLPNVDALVSIVVHEVLEIISDPLFNAWFISGSGEENADCCEWQFGITNTLDNGAIYNVEFPGGHKYLLQQQLVLNGESSYCTTYLF
jgi:hypothetical protein